MKLQSKYTITGGGSTVTHSKTISMWTGLDWIGPYLFCKLVLPCDARCSVLTNTANQRYKRMTNED